MEETVNKLQGYRRWIAILSLIISGVLKIFAIDVEVDMLTMAFSVMFDIAAGGLTAWSIRKEAPAKNPLELLN